MKLPSRIGWRFKRQKRLYQKVKTVIRRGNLFYGQNACLIAHVYNCEKIMHLTQFHYSNLTLLILLTRLSNGAYINLILPVE